MKKSTVTKSGYPKLLLFKNMRMS